MKLIFILFALLFSQFTLAVSDYNLSELKRQAVAEGLSSEAFDNAFNYLHANPQTFENQNYLTIVDYSLPSSRKRMFLFDLNKLTVSTLLVAHGKNSGGLFAESFSNQHETGKSSLGFYKTLRPYTSSKVGPALRLEGLSSTNSNARARGIVLHGAWYVSPEVIKQQGRLGRSQGCPAVEEKFNGEVIDHLAGGSLIYGYHVQYSKQR